MHESLAERRQELVDLFRSAQSEAELDTLLEGVLTPQEIEEISLRWRLMTRLVSGQTQRQISKELGVSLGTISRGSRLLQYGPPRFRDYVERRSRSS
ncbi:MAG: hypothetical protein A3K19_21615 [Lentisphaerae bacterium RIFOXYB12_FULL_65_16]|nr:MAG: hypothetical protein A3K18_20865 [Lentisphaerae bacterium RIFOXYA12_64_32]OGV93866.1 MAG: hypothetical protein A3K19_21615 [Lentisphaerae bacterium RIFOXYB12_FULL_65_16]